VSSAIEAIPQASLASVAWTGVCVALEVGSPKDAPFPADRLGARSSSRSPGKSVMSPFRQAEDHLLQRLLGVMDATQLSFELRLVPILEVFHTKNVFHPSTICVSP